MFSSSRYYVRVLVRFCEPVQIVPNILKYVRACTCYTVAHSNACNALRSRIIVTRQHVVFVLRCVEQYFFSRVPIRDRSFSACKISMEKNRLFL